MEMSFSRLSPGLESAQVWRQLDTDLRQQTITVVAQMAFNVLKTRTVPFQQEIDDDHPIACEQATQ
jgi:hypothetical protein